MIINSLEDGKDLKIPDIYKNERTPDRLNGAKLFQKELNGTVPLVGWVEGLLAEASDLADIDNVLRKMFNLSYQEAVK